MRHTLKFLSIVALLVVVATASAQVVGSVHDFSSTGTSTYKGTSDQTCVYCHTPHGGSTTAPLWNHNLSSASYTMYSSATIDMNIAATPGSVSAACLSCHDGTIAIDAFGGSTGTAGNVIPAGDPHLIGPDLSNDHPISVTYDPTLDTAFRTVAQVTDKVAATGKLVLYGAAGSETVECGSCHNPHLTTYTPFLRKSNASSGICTTCHVK